LSLLCKIWRDIRLTYDQKNLSGILKFLTEGFHGYSNSCAITPVPLPSIYKIVHIVFTGIKFWKTPSRQILAPLMAIAGKDQFSKMLKSL
jgi:hypothetical protein